MLWEGREARVMQPEDLKEGCLEEQMHFELSLPGQAEVIQAATNRKGLPD